MFSFCVGVIDLVCCRRDGSAVGAYHGVKHVFPLAVLCIKACALEVSAIYSECQPIAKMFYRDYNVA